MAKDRYKLLREKNGKGVGIMPPIKIKDRNTDVFRLYNSDKTRLDRISAEVYEDDGYGWLILMANPEYFMEFDIPKETVLRIPLPLREVLTEVEGKLLRKKQKN
tara:strand:- start:1372 stop:1683 length:312 start_codon:yes stop_codon:yes gene_type:complete